MCEKLTDKIVCIKFALGCPRSEHDAEKLVKYFKANDWHVTYKFQDADIILLFTCGFNQDAEETSVLNIFNVKREMKKNAKLIIFGCLPGINENRLKDMNVSTITKRSIHDLDNLISAKVKLCNIKDPNKFNGYIKIKNKDYNLINRLRIFYFRMNKFIKQFTWKNLSFTDIIQLINYFHNKITMISHAFEKKSYLPFPNEIFNIKISQGCLDECSYCAIRFSDGPFQSKPLNIILDEFNKGLKEKYHFIRLIGSDVGAYGQDVDKNIVILLKELFKFKENFKIIWTDFHPRWLIKYFNELLDIIVSNSHRIGYIGFPVQSGSDKILNLMNRDYTIKEFKNCIINIKKKCPKLRINTQILVGFPGETEEDFEHTIKLLKTIEFYHVLYFKYSDRPNISASLLSDKLPSYVIDRRIRTLHKKYPHTYFYK